MPKKLTYKHVKSVVKSMNGILLSKEYKNNSTKLEVQCSKCNHIWNPIFASIKNKHWCPQCYDKKRGSGQRHSYKYIKREIEKRGGTLLSKEYKNNHTKLKVRCNECNCEWEPIFSSIISNEWCPECYNRKRSNKQRHSYRHIKQKIENMNGILLSKEYKNNKTKLKVRCNKCNHEWESIFNDIQQNHWCPNCSIGKAQKLLQNIVQQIFFNFVIESNYKDFLWLYNKQTKRTQEIDIFIPKIRLAIEYDGEQHFSPICFGGISQKQAEKEFKDTKRRDRRKNRLMKKHKNDIHYFIRFNYKESITEEYVLEKLAKANVPMEGKTNA